MIALRALIPSWRFFNRSLDQVELQYRLNDESDWQDAAPEPHCRSVFNLFLNPSSTLRLAFFSLLDQAIHELNESTDDKNTPFQQSVSFSLLCNWIQNLPSIPSARSYQFRILQNQKEIYVSAHRPL